MVADLGHVLLGLKPGPLSDSRSQEVERVETMNERDKKKTYKASVDLLKCELLICLVSFTVETPQRHYVTALTFPAPHTCFCN